MSSPLLATSDNENLKKQIVFQYIVRRLIESLWANTNVIIIT